MGVPSQHAGAATTNQPALLRALALGHRNGENTTGLIHIGHRQAGWMGLAVAGISFIFPAVLIVSGFAWAYVRYGSLPQVAGVLYGVKPVIIAVVLQALWSLGRAAIKTKFLAAVSIVGVALTFLGINELLILFGCGVVVSAGRLVVRQIKSGHNVLSLISASPLALFSQSGTTAVTASAFGLLPLFLFFLKVGAVLFGSGYVLLAFIRADLVERWHWLTESQLLDAIRISKWLWPVIVVAAYFLIMRWVLPRFGVPT